MSSLDGADGGPERSGFADGGATISCSTSDSQNMDSFDDLALNVADAGTTQCSSEIRLTESCPVRRIRKEHITEDWFSEIVED